METGGCSSTVAVQRHAMLPGSDSLIAQLGQALR